MMCSINILHVFVTAFVGCTVFQSVSPIQTYRMDDACGQEISMISKMIYQGQLTHQIQKTYENNIGFWSFDRLSYCKTSIKSWDDRLMFYFQNFSLPCHIGYLTFYDGNPDGHPSKIPGLEKMCGEDVPEETYTTVTNYLTIEYTVRSARDAGNAFSLIFTSYKSGACPRYRHLCDNGRCIDKDLLCNGFKSCGDESSSCPTSIGSAAIAGIVIGSVILVCVVATTVILINICRRRQFIIPVQAHTVPRQHTAVVNPMYGGY